MNDLLAQLVERLNAEPHPFSEGWYVARCVFHEDKHPSMNFDASGYSCPACGAVGDLEKLIRAVEEAEEAEGH